MPGIALSTRRSLLTQQSNYMNKVLSTAASNLIAYWPLNEIAGTTLRDATAAQRNGVSTGFDLLYPGIGDGLSCPFLDGVNDFGNIYSSGFASAFSGSELTLALWFKVSAVGVWTDTVARYGIFLRVDANNLINIRKAAGNNAITYQYTAGGTNKQPQKTSISDTGWIHVAVTISKAADQMQPYYAGAAVGAVQTGLGTWAGALASTLCLIGAGATTPSNVFSGNLAHVGVWTTALTAAQVANLAVLR